ncbi:MAG: methyltransferase, CheR-type, SAM-binding domain, C-terminal [Gemmatimonadetes bacterium]|nr:methyltransferase, CheR-type, SAM-binding domain, C-terminal [Gemmatimonadota bacterium]
MTQNNSGGAGRLRGYHSELFALADAPFSLLRELIMEKTGMYFDDAKRGLLADKLSELVAVNGLTSFLDYYYLLRHDENADAHLNALMNRLSVPETYFWRQSEQILAMSEVIAPTHFATKPRAPLRVWSAACCTGEEPVSLAIALAEVGLLDAQPIEIVGTDGSPAMVARARANSFGPRSFRQIPANLKERYFEPDGDRWRPIERIRRAVSYDVANLAVPAEFAGLATADVIFCRNVFIYFADDVIRRVARTFCERMPDDGCVFLGAAESLTRLNVDLELAEIGKAFAYVKAGRRHHIERTNSAILATRTATHVTTGH